jgi:hypothetical protein
MYEEPIEKEIEAYIVILGMKYKPSKILKEMDPIGYNCEFDHSRDYRTGYACPFCGSEFNDYYSAKFCCQSEDDNDDN